MIQGSDWFCYLWLSRQMLGYAKQWAASRLSPVELPIKPAFTPAADASVIVPTLAVGDELEHTIRTFLDNEPLEIIIVSTVAMETSLQPLISRIENSSPSPPTKIRLVFVPSPGKRRQLARGIREARGSILVLADDDVFWQPRTLRLMLACFDDQEVAGVGTIQEGRRPAGSKTSSGEFSTVWEHLGHCRLQRRAYQIAAMNFLDASVTCLSGRTAAYRASVLKQSSFLETFTSDYWMGGYLLDSGDDTFLTRHLLREGWKIKIQTHPDAVIATTLEPSARFLLQVLRWSRNATRSYLRCIFCIPILWRTHPLLLLEMALALINPFIKLLELAMLASCWYTWVCSATTTRPGTETTRPHLHMSDEMLGTMMSARALVLLRKFYTGDDSARLFFAQYLFNLVYPFIRVYTCLTLHKFLRWKRVCG